MTHVYRLQVTYPPGSLEYGWEPPEPSGWAPERSFTPEGEDDDVFRWPQNRLCLTLGTAKRRAKLFRTYGAEVTIERSDLVTWPDAGGAR